MIQSSLQHSNAAASVYRVTFVGGQYVSGCASNVFDAVADAIHGGACVLRSHRVLLVEMAEDSNGLLPFHELRDVVARKHEENGMPLSQWAV